ncbi:MAG: hypothetical protein KBC27_00295 [Rickettsiales bacterium]|nr:hypothetical protein [Rickettsiales bacterium]
MKHSHNKEESSISFSEHNQSLIGRYKPLIVILIFCVLLPIIQFNPIDHVEFMYCFMGYFFIFLSMFKFFDLKGFVGGFSTYDLITMRVRGYGYAYPVIEFLLGASYLSQFHITLVNVITVIIMLIGGIGVLKTIVSGHKVKCACLGTALNVPLSTVSLLENFGMGAMAAYQLFFIESLVI